MRQQDNKIFNLEDTLAATRGRLVRLCARLSGDSEAAEDLAQETLLEAWRHANKLHDPTGYLPWLWAIARNVCLRQTHRRSRELVGFSQGGLAQLVDWSDEEADLEIDLERDELAVLLDEAMALLPPTTRTVLVQRYIQETPQAEVAGRLGLSEGAVAVRLHRGKLLLRRLFSTQLRHQAAHYGLTDPLETGWQATRLWCLVCGQHHLLIKFNHPENTIAFRCPGCEPEPTVPGAEYRLSNAYFARLIGGLTQPKAVFSKTTAWVHDYFRAALAEKVAPCTHCGRVLALQRFSQEDNLPGITERHGLYLVCDGCGEAVLTSFKGLTQALPAVREFWREHGRVCTLPEHEVEVEGRLSLVSRFESVTHQATLDVISDRKTYDVIGIHRADGKAGG